MTAHTREHEHEPTQEDVLVLDQIDPVMIGLRRWISTKRK
jgi:hypothetical protein